VETPGPLPSPAEPDPAGPPAERRTIQIGERPGPLKAAPPADGAWPKRATWTPRLIAIVALAVVVVIVVLLLLFAL